MKTIDCNHLVAYVKTSKVTDWKRIAFNYLENDIPAFVYRSDDNVTFAKYAREGAVLWVIESHKASPPSLVARLELIGQLHGKLDIEVLEKSGRAEVPNGMLLAFEYGRKLRWYAVGNHKRSRFFGHNNVSKVLMKTDLHGKPAPWRGAEEWDPRFGQSLERPRRIKSGQESLEKSAQDLSGRSVFLSWKHCDFKKRHHEIRALVDALVNREIECWWDQLALPPSRALTRLAKAPELLGRLLDYGLAESTVLLALGSKAWGSPSSRDPSRNWTLGEWERVRIRFVYEIDGPPTRGWPSKPVARFQSNESLSKVVDDIAYYFDERQHIASARK